MTSPGIVVVGTSLGGLAALEVLLRALPAELALPLVVIQHRLAQSDETLALVLQLHCALSVSEPDDKEPIAAGKVYIAPADYHLLIDRGRFALSTEPRVCYARPSIDVTFESAAYAYGATAIGVILTGASRDGAEGLARIKAKGGLTIVQSPATAESATLPEAAIAASEVDRVLPLVEIAPFLLSHIQTVTAGT